MHQDKKRVVLGYDLRLRVNEVIFCLDPYIWLSLKNTNLEQYLSAFNINSIWDLSNGVNLMTEMPKSVPKGFALVAFDAPINIIDYMSDSFALSDSLTKPVELTLLNEFNFLGFDIVDLWTQTSVLHKNTALYEDDKQDFFKYYKNENQLIQYEKEAWDCCRIADKEFPFEPYQPVGIWLHKKCDNI